MRKKDTDNIKCDIVNLLKFLTSEIIFVGNINMTNITFSFTEDNCNFTKFNSEY